MAAQGLVRRERSTANTALVRLVLGSPRLSRRLFCRFRGRGGGGSTVGQPGGQVLAFDFWGHGTDGGGGGGGGGAAAGEHNKAGGQVFII